MKRFTVASSYNQHLTAVTSNEEQPVKYFWNKSKCKKVWSEKPGRTGQHWVVSITPEKKHLNKEVACEYLEHRVHGIKRRNQISQSMHKRTFVTSDYEMANCLVNCLVMKGFNKLSKEQQITFNHS